MIYGETKATIKVAPANTNYNLNNIVGATLVVAPLMKIII